MSGANDNQTDHIADAIKRIRAVSQVAGELYDERDADGRHRDLELFEGVFISAVNALNEGYAKQRAKDRKHWEFDSEISRVVERLSLRQQADDMEAAQRAYENKRRRFLGDYDDSLEAVAEVMSAAE